MEPIGQTILIEYYLKILKFYNLHLLKMATILITIVAIFTALEIWMRFVVDPWLDDNDPDDNL